MRLEAAQKTVEECQKVIAHQQRRIEHLEEKERLSDNLLRIDAEERKKALEKVAEQEESDRLVVVELQEEERRQRLMDQQEANWIRTGMDWDQQFWHTPQETGADTNTTFLKHPCKKCDKKYITEKQLEEHMTNVHKQVITKKPEYTCDSCELKSTNEQSMKDHVKLHRESIKCKICRFESKEEDLFIELAIKCHSM